MQTTYRRRHHLEGPACAVRTLLQPQYSRQTHFWTAFKLSPGSLDIRWLQRRHRRIDSSSSDCMPDSSSKVSLTNLEEVCESSRFWYSFQSRQPCATSPNATYAVNIIPLDRKKTCCPGGELKDAPHGMPPFIAFVFHSPDPLPLLFGRRLYQIAACIRPYLG